jgi:hypothetical protein
MFGNELQISVMEHGLKSLVETLLVGFIRYVSPALHFLGLRGQQAQPLLHEHD